MKKFFFFVMMMLASVLGYAQTAYDAIATAYVTTTISQNVVFNSTMQQGGTFTFSVLAHNGGGRAGQSDTANVKIQFYTSTGSLVTSVNSSYSGNLPNPNAVCGNPCIDTSVPWTTVTTSATLSPTQAASVAYAKVSMYGIDGSYWAGDYGPWYRAPTLTLNGGGNLLYNPEFGPYNGITAQGWTSSPGFGACQGAWGGSNACIVNSDGVPGTSTTGLVANQDGGGPSASGGTTSGQAGGYNNSMSVTNAGTGATAGSPPAPTVVSTTTTTTTKTVIVGNQQETITTPVTTTTYSDGSHTTTNGSSTTNTISNSAFTGVHFGAAQVADTQWDVYACTSTDTCNIYSTSPGGTYETGSWTAIGSNQYISFIPNTGSDSATNPWTMILVNSDGTYTILGTGQFLVQGTDGNGNIFLFFNNDNYNVTLLSGNLGLTGQGVSFTGTQNPTVSQTNTLSSNMSSTPLAAGQTGGTPIVTVTTGSTGPEMNVAGGGSSYAFIWQGNSGSDWPNVQLIQHGWNWYCSSCAVKTGTVGSISFVSNYSTNDSAYIHLLDSNGNPINPDQGQWYQFSSSPIATGTTTTTTTTSSSSSSNSTTSNNFSFPINTGVGTNYNVDTFGVTGVTTTTVTTTTSTPVTTTTYSDGSSTSSTGSTTTTHTTNLTYNITPSSITPAMVNPYANTGSNAVYINQVTGSYSNVLTATQYGHGNLMEIYLNGEGNTINASEGTSTVNSVSSATGLNVSGNNNSLTTQQTGTGNSAIVSITGNNNTANVVQAGNTNQSYNIISGNGNALAVNQTGNSNVSSINLSGNGNTASVTQNGLAPMSSVLNLTNAGGANNVTVNQTGSTSQSYVLQQTCTNPAGCSVSISQGH